MYRINWSSRAKKQLRKVDRQAQVSIIDAVGQLVTFPSAKNVIALTKHEFGYRMRVGNYRVLFDADTEVRIIEVQQVKKRDENTY
ncbi:type II toxin-antitoxin system RelE/ParE family toxin [Achromobacter sp. GG226]|uniref:type II toxin-antitoxin system RelE family toxin n=1 Tax=Verticiella alkaliphila TaxID=2779529 RepID=UPI001C0AF819|nr:type II toxin-antitoxin system RelE/ParE family toxin [Verticiella sp. GG226]MBU4609482.1 type II toxin-antitoxin system RelE/ParE family toxin [Verticiella sp. GG226]